MRNNIYQNIPTNYDRARLLTETSVSKSLGYNTQLLRHDFGTVLLLHHDTAIVIYHRDGSVTINPNRWRSSTTKERINKALGDSRWHISAVDRVWYWLYDGKKCFEFADKDRVFLKAEDAKKRGKDPLAIHEQACARCESDAPGGPDHHGSRACRMRSSIASGGNIAHCSCAGCF